MKKSLHARLQSEVKQFKDFGIDGSENKKISVFFTALFIVASLIVLSFVIEKIHKEERTISEAEIIEQEWIALPTSGAPTARTRHTSTFEGLAMYTWGGYDGSSCVNSGAMFHSLTKDWSDLPTTNAPSARCDHTSTNLYYFGEIVIWGGTDGSSALNTGGVYDIEDTVWRATDTTNPDLPTARYYHTAVTREGSDEVYIWGGTSDGSAALHTGSVYNSQTDTWNLINDTDSDRPSERFHHTATYIAYDGPTYKMIVWGGYNGTSALDTGGIYDFGNDTWAAIKTSDPDMPSARYNHTATWDSTTDKLLIWGGTDGSSALGDGALYDPVTDTWESINASDPDIPSARYNHTAVIKEDSEVLIWGGEDGISEFNTGSIYKIESNQWEAITTNSAPDARTGHSAVWNYVDNELIVFGGEAGGTELNTGARLSVQNYYQIAELDVALDAENSSGENIEVGSTTGVTNNSNIAVLVKDADNTYPIVELPDVDFETDLSWSTLSADSDNSQYKAFVNGINDTLEGFEDYHYTFFIPRDASHDIVRLCPGTTSLVSISETCTNGATVTDGDTYEGVYITATTKNGFSVWQLDAIDWGDYEAYGGLSFASTCGDGTIEGDEECDDSGILNNDGCSGDCLEESGWNCTSEPSNCTEIHGDGIIVGSEECDDENIANEDGCTSTGLVETGWECTGEPSSCDEIHGDGIITGSEECDDDNTTNNDGCSSIGIIESGWQCSGEPSECSAEICGDGIVAGSEECDDENTQDLDGCSSNCLVESGWNCGNSPSSCSEVCGDSIVTGNEVCDSNAVSCPVGNYSGTKSCNDTCSAWNICITDQYCGDFIVNGNEECDDGNTSSGDGCSNVCVLENQTQDTSTDEAEDIDRDDMPDQWEREYDCLTVGVNDASRDPDGDLLFSIEEYPISTDPCDEDTDDDGLDDGEENVLGINPNNTDSDADGLTDYDEVRVYETDPIQKDTDGDGYSDKDEIDNQSDPNDAQDYYETGSDATIEDLPQTGDTDSRDSEQGVVKDTVFEKIISAICKNVYVLSGILILTVAIVALIVWFKRRKKRSSSNHTTQNHSDMEVKN